MGLFGEDTSPRVKIHLDQESYTPGQLVTGHIRLTLVKSYRFTEVLVNFEGFRQSQYMTTVQSGRHRRIEVYYEKIAYFRRTISLFKQADPEEKFAIGEHLFPFSFTLPLGLPDSFEVKNMLTSFARIRYRVKLEITNPDLFRSTIRESVIFPVYNRFVRRHVPTGMAGDSEISNWFCCGSRGTVHWDVHLPKSCWTAGEVLEMTINVDNGECQVPIHGLYAELERLVVVTPERHRSEYRVVLKRIQLDRFIEAGKKDTFTARMSLPKEVMSTTQIDIFTCTYKLFVYLKVPRSFDPEIKIPIRVYRAETLPKPELPADAISPPAISMDYLHRTSVFTDEKRLTPPPAYSHSPAHRTRAE